MKLRSKRVLKREKPETDLCLENRDFSDGKRYVLRSCKKGVISEGEIEVFDDDSDDNLELGVKRGIKEMPGKRRLLLRSCKNGISNGEIKVFDDDSDDNIELGAKRGNKEMPGERRLSLRSCKKGISEAEIEVFDDDSDDNLEVDVERDLSVENKEIPGKRRLSLRSCKKGINDGAIEVFNDDSGDNLEVHVKKDLSDENKEMPGERRLSLRSCRKGISEGEVEVFDDDSDDNLEVDVKRGRTEMDLSVKNKKFPGKRRLLLRSAKGKFCKKGVNEEEVGVCDENLEMGIKKVVNTDDKGLFLGSEVLDPVKDLAVLSSKEEVEEESVERVHAEEEGKESVSIDLVVSSSKEDEVEEESVERVHVEEEGKESVSIDLVVSSSKEEEVEEESVERVHVEEEGKELVSIDLVVSSSREEEVEEESVETVHVEEEGKESVSIELNETGPGIQKEAELPNLVCENGSQDCVIETFDDIIAIFNVNYDDDDDKETLLKNHPENVNVLYKRKREKGEEVRHYGRKKKNAGYFEKKEKTDVVCGVNSDDGECTVMPLKRKRGRKRKNVDVSECKPDKRVKTQEVKNEEVQVRKMMLRPRSLTTANDDVAVVESSESDSICRPNKKVKRGRGRPRKYGNLRPNEKRKRGRPRKVQDFTSLLEQVESLIEKNPRKKVKAKRGRGRPRKVISPEISLGPTTSRERRPKVQRKEKLGSQGIIQKKRLKDMIFKKTNRRKRLPKVEARTLATHVIKMRKAKSNEDMMDEGGHMGRSQRKQLIRDKISAMLLKSGWIIDHKKRQQKEYNDAIYVEPNGKRSHWSITRAYFFLKKKVENGNADSNEISAYSPIPSEEISMLFRKVDKERGYKKKRIGKNVNEGKTVIEKRSKLGKKTRNRSKKKVIFKPRGDKITEKRKPGLLARGEKQDNDDAVLLTKKRNLLSWMIDSGVVLVDSKIKYGKTRRQKKLFEGTVTDDGICCDCCNEIMGISEFVDHCGGKANRPFDDVYMESGTSFRTCLMNSWRKEEESSITKFDIVDVKGEDSNDDTCNICGDGGNLICCDGCPSTFHQSCLNIQNFPSGDWNCIYCSCKFCGVVSITTPEAEVSHDAIAYEMLSCCLCDQKFHRLCSQEVEDLSKHSNILPFCGRNCQELFERLQKCLGVKHDLEDGFSWTLLQRSDVGEDITARDTQLTIERNSKLAVAYSVMDECFMPIVDGRSGINVIHNVVYNCGSNIKRLNYAGFLTAVLEKDDELVTAASIRIHGYRMAEMPFIGTRHMYRRQGMCRRLLDAIESCLNSLGVEELTIPAIPELLQTWTKVFGFVAIEESKKEAMKCMNMMVFPYIDMLTKPLLQNHSAHETPHLSAVSDDKAVECTIETNEESISQLEAVSSNPIDYEEQPSDAAQDKNVVDREQTKEATAIVDDGNEQTVEPTVEKDDDVRHPENDEVIDIHGATNSLCDLNFPATTNGLLPCDTGFQTSIDSVSFPGSCTVEPNSMDSVNCRSPEELVPKNTFDLNLHPSTVAETDMHIVVSDDSQACTTSFEISDSRSQVDCIPAVQPDSKPCECQTLILL